MKNRNLQMTKAALFVLVLTMIGMTNTFAQEFTVGKLKYAVLDDGKSVAIKGRFDGIHPEGNFEIPETVTYNGKTYSVTKINYDGFAGCNKLTAVTIPNSVISIEQNAFAGCIELTAVVIPKSVTFIGNNPFVSCTVLTRVIVDPGNTVYDSRENCNAIIDKTTNTLIVGCKNSFIPNSVTSIGDKAFCGCKGLTSITIPNSVTSIGESAFAGTGLTIVTIPNTVTSIGNRAFQNTGLTSITIPNSVTSLGANAFIYTKWYEQQPNGLLYLNGWCLGHKGMIKDELKFRNNTKHIASRAFEGRDDLPGIIVLPNSVISIGEYAFCSCRGIHSVTIPNSVISIGNSAFAFCEGLTSITIPRSVTFIEDNPFVNCTALTRVMVDPGNTVYDSRENCNAIIEKSSNTLIVGCKNSFIPNSVTSIGGGAFYGCYLASITIPNSVTTIGIGAFSCCSYLTSITIPSSVTTIGERAFAYCNRLTSVIIESHNLRKLSFEGNLEECKNIRESDVFEECENLHKSNIIYR